MPSLPNAMVTLLPRVCGDAAGNMSIPLIVHEDVTYSIMYVYEALP